MAIHQENSNNNKKTIRHRPFYEASKNAVSTDNKVSTDDNTISDSKVDELIKRVKSELEKQIKKEDNPSPSKDNTSDDEPGTQEDELLVESIQDDIKVKEELLKTLIASQEKYNIMKENYEKKLKSLQNSIVHAQLERDEALKRIPNKNDNRDNSSAHINNRYIERINRLKNEVTQLKKKYEEATLSISSAKNQNTNQIKTMKINIESLKAEKAKMMRKIREERERANSKTLEIKKLKKKEYEASQLAKKLEQSNQLQQILLKRRKDEMKACQRKMKSMMDYLNRSNIPKTISKSPRRKKPRSAMLRQSDKDKDEILMNSIDLNEDSRLKRKKQMLDHELDQCIISQETQHMIDEMEKKKTRLLDEQKELKNEREKIIRIESAKSKSYDPDQPQYMDDRLEMIDAELQLINSRIKEARKNIILTDGANGDENGFSNAINIIKSTSFDNLQKLSEMLLSDIVEMKLKERHHMAQVASNERTIADLRVTLQVMKKTAVSAAIEYERKVKDLRNQQAYRQDQANKTSLSEFDDNYSDVTGGEMDDEDDVDISNILKKEKSIVENDADDNWLGKGEIYKKIYETGVIKGGRAEAVVSAAASNQNSSTEDVDLSNNEASLDYISTSYTPGLPFEIYQNINEYKNEESKEDNGEGEYLNDDDLNLPVTPVNKQLNDASLFVKPLSSGEKLDNSPFLSPNTENTIINTIINSGTLVNTSTPYKEFDINTPLKSKGKQSLSPIEFSQNHDSSPLEKTISISKDHHNIKTTYTNTDTTDNTNTNTNYNTYINTNTNNNTDDNIIETNNSNSNKDKSSNDKKDTLTLPWSSASDSDINKKSSQTVITPSKNSNLSTTPIKLGNNNISSIPISSSKKTKKFEFKKPDEIIKSKNLISPPKNNSKNRSPSGSTTTTLNTSNKTPKKDNNDNKANMEEKSPAKKSSFMSTLKNSTHFLAAFHNPFTSPKKSPIKTFLSIFTEFKDRRK